MANSAETGKFWWEKNWFLAFLLLLSVVPLLWPTFPPLTDLAGHMGRYRVQLDLASDPALQQFYTFDWALILNLGGDLLMEPLGHIFGVELGTKLLVMLTMLLTTTGLIWIAREVHGRVPPTAMLALPFIYGHVTSFGFINYMLSVALAFNLFAFWIYCDRTERQVFRTWFMVPASFVLAICHVYGWCILGLLVFGYELYRARERGGNLLYSCWTAGMSSLILVGPIFILLFWRIDTKEPSITEEWFNIQNKFVWLLSTLRDRWGYFDRFCVILLGVAVIRAVFSGHMPIAKSMHNLLGLLLLAFITLPYLLMSSAYADMRITPVLLMMLCVSLSWPIGLTRRQMNWIGIAALAFFSARIASNTISYALYDAEYKRELAALNYIPKHARLYSATTVDCEFDWFAHRKDHLSSLALVRNRAYANDQWVAAGAQLIRSKFSDPNYSTDRSQFVIVPKCKSDPKYKIDVKLQGLPRNQFDYVWLISVPHYKAESVKGMTRLWADGNSAVYRIDR